MDSEWQAFTAVLKGTITELLPTGTTAELTEVQREERGSDRNFPDLLFQI